MKLKFVLFAGILLLTTGIILRIFTDIGFTAILLIIVGVVFKTYYIIRKARSGEYKPGNELIILFVGLTLFFTGLYFRIHNPSYHYDLLIVSGLILKMVYIILFVLKVRSKDKQSASRFMYVLTEFTGFFNVKLNSVLSQNVRETLRFHL